MKNKPSSFISVKTYFDAVLAEREKQFERILHLNTGGDNYGILGNKKKIHRSIWPL